MPKKTKQHLQTTNPEPEDIEPEEYGIVDYEKLRRKKYENRISDFLSVGYFTDDGEPLFLPYLDKAIKNQDTEILAVDLYTRELQKFNPDLYNFLSFFLIKFTNHIILPSEILIKTINELEHSSQEEQEYRQFLISKYRDIEVLEQLILKIDMLDKVIGRSVHKITNYDGDETSPLFTIKRDLVIRLTYFCHKIKGNCIPLTKEAHMLVGYDKLPDEISYFLNQNSLPEDSLSNLFLNLTAKLYYLKPFNLDYEKLENDVTLDLDKISELPFHETKTRFIAIVTKLYDLFDCKAKTSLLPEFKKKALSLIEKKKETKVSDRKWRVTISPKGREKEWAVRITPEQEATAEPEPCLRY